MDDVAAGDEVVGRHRRALLRTFDIVQTLITEAEKALADPASIREPDRILGLSERMTICDVTVKLTGVLTKVIALERESHGLDARIDPKELGDDQLLRLLQRTAHERSGQART